MKGWFDCNHCGEGFAYDSFQSVAGYHGLILLRGTEDFMLGGFCPKCNKISLEKRDKGFIQTWVLQLIVQGWPKKSTHLYYDSFPYMLDFQKLKLPAPVFQYIKPLTTDDKMLVEDEVDEDFGQPAYCTYTVGHEATGPAMTVWWFKEEDISELLRFENESGVKVFPRYVGDDQLKDEMDRFCYDHHLELELFASESAADSEAFFVKLKNEINPWQKRIRENYELLNILSMPHQTPIEMYLEYLSKVDAGAQEAGPPFDERCEQENAPVRKEPPKLCYDQHPGHSEDRPSYERMSEVIWAKFNNGYVQDLLSHLAASLVKRYIQLAARTDFEAELAWRMKDEYLKELYQSVISPEAALNVRKGLTDEEIEELREAESRFPGVKIVSNDLTISRIKISLSKIARVEKKDVSFLILGESGTGKELFARAIHEASGRKEKFVVADCGAQSETLFESELFGHVKGAFTGAIKDKKGAFELADGGTIFLDEIGNLTAPLQPKMLRVLQEHEIQPVGAEFTKEVDVKIVLATNKDLAKMVEEGRFMPDLYQRFKRPRFEIPPLRERKGDIPSLVEHFVKKHDVEGEKDPDLPPIKVSPDCMHLLMNYDWKEGNARELEKVIDEIILYREGGKDRREITPHDLPIEITQAESSVEPRVQPKEDMPGNTKTSDHQIKYWMEKLNGNKSEVARKLGVTYKTVQRRWKKLEHNQMS